MSSASVTTRAQANAAAANFNKRDVVHLPEKKKFVLRLPGRDPPEEATLEYELLDEGKYDYVHTYTPPAWRGKGISDIVSSAAMDFIKDNNYKVALTCGYLSSTFIDRHPEYRSVLLESDPMCKIPK